MQVSLEYQTLVTSLPDNQIPNDIQEALQKPEWKTAVYEEFWALEKNRIQELVDLRQTKEYSWM